MIKCPKCSTDLPDGAKFCPYCGPIGGKVSGGMEGSVAVRSPGAGSVYAPSISVGKVDKKYCPSCGTPITDRNRSIRCFDCGTFLCATCELDFRTERKPGERPYCSNCFTKRQELIKQEQIRLEEEKKKAVEKDIIENSIGMKLKLIPAGEFMMGSSEWEDTQPIHKVKITNPFYIGIYPITQREWSAVMGKNPSEFNGNNLPVENVSWHDCQEFIEKLNAKEGTYKYRLPTEEEWEYACRAGSTTKYCYGDDKGRLSDYAWYDANSNHKTHQAGVKKPNVWEWCQDN